MIKDMFSMRMRLTYPPSTTPAGKPDEPENTPVDFEQWTQYVLATELREEVRDEGEKPQNGPRPHGAHGPLLRVLRRESGADAVAGQSARRRLTMLRAPTVFTLGLASDTAHASKCALCPPTRPTYSYPPRRLPALRPACAHLAHMPCTHLASQDGDQRVAQGD